MAETKADAMTIAKVVAERVMSRVTNWPSTGSAPATFMQWAIAELLDAGCTITLPQYKSIGVSELTGPRLGFECNCELRRMVAEMWPR